MLGQAISMVLPEVIGYKITGQMNQLSTSTDIVLTITKVGNSGQEFAVAGFLVKTRIFANSC